VFCQFEWRCLLRCCTGNVIGKCFVSSSGDAFCIVVPEMLSASVLSVRVVMLFASLYRKCDWANVLSVRVAMPFASLYRKCNWEVFCQFEWRCFVHRCTGNVIGQMFCQFEWRCLLHRCTGNVIGKCFVNSSGDALCIVVLEM